MSSTATTRRRLKRIKAEESSSEASAQQNVPAVSKNSNLLPGGIGHDGENPRHNRRSRRHMARLVH
jgi:hypothetical protein